MSAMTKLIGLRIRNYRIQSGLNQEQLAELAGCHPTYIGQIERGEKNATIESILKITKALKILCLSFLKILTVTEEMRIITIL